MRTGLTIDQGETVEFTADISGSLYIVEVQCTYDGDIKLRVYDPHNELVREESIYYYELLGEDY